MPGLPGSDVVHDLEQSSCLFSDSSFCPDGIKLYPTLVVAGTELEKWYLGGRYQPYSEDELTYLMMNIKTLVPQYVRIPRVMRDMPPQFIVAGCKDLALRSALKQKMEEAAVRCKCIRCREYGHRMRDGWRIGAPMLKRFDYEASGGKEIFLSFEDENGTLFGLLRLRFGGLVEGLDGVGMVRELHVFGSEVPLGEKHVDAAQHRGLGKELLVEAERISRSEFKASRMAVISGVGARDYFRNECGYQLEGFYMVKKLD
jgi:elongator complex protein 3